MEEVGQRVSHRRKRAWAAQFCEQFFKDVYSSHSIYSLIIYPPTHSAIHLFSKHYIKYMLRYKDSALGPRKPQNKPGTVFILKILTL